MIIRLTLLLALFVSINGYSQKFNKSNRYLSIGGCVNTMNYIGDVDPGPSFVSPGMKFTRYNIGITGLYRMSPRISARGTISYGKISGSDATNANYETKNIYRKYRNASFDNNIFEVKADLVFDLFENRKKYNKRVDFTPYGFIGIAYFHHNPTVQWNGEKYKLRELSTEGQGLNGGAKPYSLHQIALPIGAGIRMKLTKHLDLAFEIGWRFTTTDYLDDVGGNYYDPRTLQQERGKDAAAIADRSYEAYTNDDKLAAEAAAMYGGDGTYVKNNGMRAITGFGSNGDQRGDKKARKDLYIITGFHLTYILPDKVICPKFR
jgi:hypothetical protein